MYYNDNIILINPLMGAVAELRDIEYYALMVEDKWQGYTDTRDFFNRERGMLGLECTSDKKVYISKVYATRCNPARGRTYLVSVINPKLCVNLTY